ncbi:hypothetical protein Tco_0531594 [Tanacetum coccineum]
MGTCAPYSKRDTFTPLTKTLKEILAMESIKFPPPSPLIGTLEKKILNKFCDYHGDRGHNTNDCYHLKKQIKEVVASGKLAHLVKDILQRSQRNRGQGHGNVKVINMVGLRGSRKRPYEVEEPGLTDEISFLTIPRNSLANAPIILEVKAEKVWCSSCWVLGGNLPSPRANRPQGNHGRFRKEQSRVAGVCHSKMPLSLLCHPGKNENEKPWSATLQRVMDKVLAKQKGRNVEVYIEEAVIKSKSEQDLIEDVEETLYKVQRVNMKLDKADVPSG